jgi:hypothetical protein
VLRWAVLVVIPAGLVGRVVGGTTLVVITALGVVTRCFATTVVARPEVVRSRALLIASRFVAFVVSVAASAVVHVTVVARFASRARGAICASLSATIGCRDLNTEGVSLELNSIHFAHSILSLLGGFKNLTRLKCGDHTTYHKTES